MTAGTGGTNTLQRNLAHLFVWLEQAHDHPNHYTARLNRYAPVKKRPRDAERSAMLLGAASPRSGTREFSIAGTYWYSSIRTVWVRFDEPGWITTHR